MEERVKAGGDLMDDILELYRKQRAKPENKDISDEALLRVASECIGISNKEQRMSRNFNGGREGGTTLPPTQPEEVKCAKCAAVVKKKKNKITGVPYFWCRNCDKKLNPDGTYFVAPPSAPPA